MIIHATKKTLSALELPTDTTVSSDKPHQSWHAKLIDFDEDSALLFMHDTWRLCVVLMGVVPIDFTDLDTHFYATLEQALMLSGFSKHFIKRITGSRPKLVYRPARDLSLISRLNKREELERFGYRFADPLTVSQPHLSKALNQQYFSLPNKRATHALGAVMAHFNLPEDKVYAGKAYEIDIRLEASKPLLRRFIVPSWFRLSWLHDVIQDGFAWERQQEHVFLSERHGKVCYYGTETDDILDEDEPFYAADRKTVEDYFSNGGKHVYLYDLRATHIHHLQVKVVHQNYYERYPICIKAPDINQTKDRPSDSGSVQATTFLHQLFNSTSQDADSEDIRLMQINTRIHLNVRFNIE